MFLVYRRGPSSVQSYPVITNVPQKRELKSSVSLLSSHAACSHPRRKRAHQWSDFSRWKGLLLPGVTLSKDFKGPEISGRVLFPWFHFSSFIFLSNTVSSFATLVWEAEAEQRVWKYLNEFLKKESDVDEEKAGKTPWNWGYPESNTLLGTPYKSNMECLCPWARSFWPGLVFVRKIFSRRFRSAGLVSLTSVTNSSRPQWPNTIKMYCFLTSWSSVVRSSGSFYLVIPPSSTHGLVIRVQWWVERVARPISNVHLYFPTSIVQNLHAPV